MRGYIVGIDPAEELTYKGNRIEWDAPGSFVPLWAFMRPGWDRMPENARRYVANWALEDTLRDFQPRRG